MLLTPDDFTRRAVGLPWVRWRADWAGMDCFGLLVLWHREVLGIDLGPVPQTDIADGFARASGWQECAPEDGATCFMAWRSGAPSHCGVLLAGGQVLHSEGSPEKPGSVRVSRLSAMQRLYGDLRFYRRAAAC